MSCCRGLLSRISEVQNEDDEIKVGEGDSSVIP
jgi:hypothetical protein